MDSQQGGRCSAPIAGIVNITMENQTTVSDDLIEWKNVNAPYNMYVTQLVTQMLQHNKFTLLLMFWVFF